LGIRADLARSVAMVAVAVERASIKNRLFSMAVNPEKVVFMVGSVLNLLMQDFPGKK
jgi:hypothetical protein